MERLTVPIEWKASIDDAGTLEGFASTFGNVDLGGDVVIKGAFKKTNARVKAEGIPLLADHVASTASVLGTIFDAVEDTKGLKIKARFSSAASAQDVRTKLIEGHLGKLSIGYEATKFAYEDREGKTVRLLQEVKLWEVSVVVMPMNPEAVVSRVKSLTSVLDAGQRKTLAAEIIAAPEEKATANDTRDQLNTLLRETYGAEGVDIWVRDFDDTKVWFEVWSGEDRGMFEQAYEESDGGSLSLDGERTKVRPVTTYIAEDKSADIPGAAGGQSGDEPDGGAVDETARGQAGDESAGGNPDEGKQWDHWASEAVLAGHDPAEVADTADVAGMRARLELMEKSLGVLENAPVSRDVRADLAETLRQSEADLQTRRTPAGR